MKLAMITLAVTSVLFAGCDKGHDASGPHHHEKSAEKPAADGKVKDPVCGMTIAKGDRKAEFDKTDYFFCADACLEKFKATPTKYVKACDCATTMKSCDCEHCTGKRAPCDCGGH